MKNFSYSKLVNQINRIFPSHRLVRFFSSICSVKIIYPNGYYMLYKPSDATNQYAFYRIFSQNILNVINSLGKGEVFVDIGANCGLWTLPAAGRVGPEGKVIAFEPQVGVFTDLLANVAANGFSNVAAFPAAIGRATRWIRMTLEDPHHSGAGFVSNAAGDCQAPMMDGAIIVALLDATPLRRRGLGVKIDVEGYEYEVLRAIEPLLSRPELRFVIVECDSSNLARFGSSTADVHALMREHSLVPSVCNSDEFPRHYDEVFLPVGGSKIGASK